MTLLGAGFGTKVWQSSIEHTNPSQPRRDDP